MAYQQRSSSNPNISRWSSGLIRSEQPPLRRTAPDDEDLEKNVHVTYMESGSEEHLKDAGIQDAEDTDHRKVEGKTRAKRTHPPTSNAKTRRSIVFDWWKEMLSVTVAVACTASSVLVLVYMNGRSLSEWQFRLQPNTFIALLATITRATLIHPLAECLGYLKWRFFESPRTLTHLQTFDEASRGPLGSLKYLWTLPIHSPIATCATLMTTLLLLFQPFAQQTINFASRVAALPDETAHAFRATKWNTSNFGNQSDSGDLRKSSKVHVR
jgi:hypothetical protein